MKNSAEEFSINFAVRPFFERGDTITEFTFLADPPKGYTNFTFDWNFGDGSHGKGVLNHKVYEKAGNYEVTLTATALDASGTKVQAQSPTKTMIVKDNPGSEDSKLKNTEYD